MEKLTVEQCAAIIYNHMGDGGGFTVGTLRQLFTFDYLDRFAAALKQLEKDGRICRFYDRTGTIRYKVIGAYD